VIIGLFRLIFYTIIAYLIYKFILAVLVPRPRSQTRQRSEGRSGVMVKDEVCNTYLPKEDAIEQTIGGREHYFCSQECRRKFDQERSKNA
jgi:uncharacterized protein